MTSPTSARDHPGNQKRSVSTAPIGLSGDESMVAGWHVGSRCPGRPVDAIHREQTPDRDDPPPPPLLHLTTSELSTLDERNEQ